MEQRYECLIVGAGMAGAIAARELAQRGGRRVLVLERRAHIVMERKVLYSQKVYTT